MERELQTIKIINNSNYKTDKIRHTCTDLENLLKDEIEVIEGHIDEHKWFKHISNKEDGVKDFINEYGWIMKEMYCRYVCKDKCLYEYKGKRK